MDAKLLFPIQRQLTTNLQRVQNTGEVLTAALNCLSNNVSADNFSFWVYRPYRLFITAFMNRSLASGLWISDTQRHSIRAILHRCLEGPISFGRQKIVSVKESEFPGLTGIELCIQDCHINDEPFGAFVLAKRILDQCPAFSEEEKAIVEAVEAIFSLYFMKYQVAAKIAQQKLRKSKNSSADWWKRGESPPY